MLFEPATLHLLLVLVSNFDVHVIAQRELPTRFMCEIEAGRLVQPLTRRIYGFNKITIEDNEFYVFAAGCKQTQ